MEQTEGHLVTITRLKMGPHDMLMFYHTNCKSIDEETVGGYFSLPKYSHGDSLAAVMICPCLALRLHLCGVGKREKPLAKHLFSRHRNCSHKPQNVDFVSISCSPDSGIEFLSVLIDPWASISCVDVSILDCRRELIAASGFIGSK
jgi:hypothetical protein